MDGWTDGWIEEEKCGYWGLEIGEGELRGKCFEIRNNVLGSERRIFMNFCAILFARSSISSFDVEVNIFPFIIIVSRRETIFLISVSFHGFKILFCS